MQTEFLFSQLSMSLKCRKSSYSISCQYHWNAERVLIQSAISIIEMQKEFLFNLLSISLKCRKSSYSISYQYHWNAERVLIQSTISIIEMYICRYYTGTPDHHNIGGVADGAQVYYQCFNGYRLKGQPILVCKEGEWQGNIPVCGECKTRGRIIKHL